MAQQIQWGITTLILDNEAFRRGFLAARRWYYEDTYGEDGRHPEEPQRAQSLTSEEVLRLIVMPDEQGRYHFDEMGSENLPEFLGYLVGYLSAPLAAHEAEHYRKEQVPQEYLCSSVTAQHDKGQEHFSTLSQEHSMRRRRKDMARTSNPGIYIRCDGEEYYVGQSKDVTNRDAHHSGRLLARFVAPEDKHERRMIETEMIQFMDAAGVPLANIHQRKEPRVGIELDEEYG